MKNLCKKTAGKILVLCLLVAFINCSEENESITLQDYERAEKFLGVNTSPLVYGTFSSPEWQSNERLIYRTTTNQGTVYMYADPVNNVRDLAFDHEKLANSISGLDSEEHLPYELSLRSINLDDEGKFISYSIGGKRYKTDLSNYETLEIKSLSKRNEYVSPNGKRAAFIRNYNLWIRDTESDKENQLTFDGEKEYGYATNNAGWIKSDGPVLLWSPNSDKIATFQHDERGVGEMYLYNTQVGHSKLEVWKYPLPGDSLIFRIDRIVIHLEPRPRIVRLKMPPDPHRSTISDHVASRAGKFLDVEWSEDQTQLAFVSSSRDHKVAELKIADTNTGEVRSIIKEVVETYFEGGNRLVNWHVLKESNEAIWFSERDNWGHLYLYDLSSGQLKHQITSGEWSVLQVRHIDQENRQIYFMGSNKEEGDPYFQYLYRVNMDGSSLVNLTPDNANHVINISQSKAYFSDSYSTPEIPPTTVIRSIDGSIVLPLEEGDFTDLLAAGWVPPIPFTVKARDETTDLHGLMYKPSNFDPSIKYPILNYLYPGPQSGSVGVRSFRSSRSDKQSLAELGFIVVEVDAMGSPGRSKSFHDAWYGNMGDNGLPDQISMVKQLAAINSWMDIDRVGIWGHSGGGFASTDGILRYPEFYKVAVSGAGNHDNRNYEDDWGEKWQGLLVRNPQTSGGEEESSLAREIRQQPDQTNYDNQANQLLADNLQGKLLIAHGMLDSNVPPTNTLLVVDALIKADKDFDMLVFPNARHGFGNSRYFLKRRWDYFVENLRGLEPPEGFVFKENIR